MTLQEIEQLVFAEIIRVTTAKELEEVQHTYLGRKGHLTAILRGLSTLSLEEKRTIGEQANALRVRIETALKEQFGKLEGKGEEKFFDITFPGKKVVTGHLNPLTLILREIEDIFISFGFSVVEGPEVETEFNNFDALNIPANHPAREMWDTFWLKPENQKLLLRTHTSPVQIRYMMTHEPPFRIIVPGTTYRYEATDARHEMQFTQVEGLVVGKDVTLANFKAVIEAFFIRLFAQKVEIRLRPGYFPFVEPGVEVDATCPRCKKKGCELCKFSGWLELGGAGMVHPNVFDAVKYNPKEVQGFAFGIGAERFAMIKYGIPDIRLFRSGDLRFIRQF
ncbi:MAG: phenylalanine--tRNA ligase subunit alpha [Parcubacteria group bacterium]|nr:phenylalanine--tRNA ligase subunit alpha [Parcubacteria group bacterium]